MEGVRQQFESWRNTHAHRSRIPETLWRSAVEVARQPGLHRTAKALHLDYTKLKALVGGDAAAKPKKEMPAFVELLTPADRLPECVVELENARGKKMRIHLREPNKSGDFRAFVTMRGDRFVATANVICLWRNSLGR